MNRKQIKRAFVQQRDQTDCGAACLLSLVTYYGGESTLESIREKAGTGTSGTTLFGLHEAARYHGFDADGCEATIDDVISHGQPLILHVNPQEQLKHYVICYGKQDETFVISDPAIGIMNLTRRELEKIWVSGKCLTLTPNKDFAYARSMMGIKISSIVELVRDDGPVLLISLLYGVAISLLGIVMSLFSQRLVDHILPERKLNELVVGVLLVGVLLALQVWLSATRKLLLLRQSKDFNNRIINMFYRRLLKLPKSFFDNRKIGDLVARLNDTSRIQRVITTVAGSIVIDFITVVTTLGVLFYYSITIAVISLAVVPIYFAVIVWFNRKVVDAQYDVLRGYALSESNFINTIQGVAVVKNTGKEDFFAEQNSRIYGSMQDKSVHLGRLNIRLGVITGLFGLIVLIGIVLLASRLVFADALKVGELVAVLGIAGLLLASVSNLAMAVVPITEARVAFERMFEFMKRESQADRRSESIDEPLVSLSLRNISFHFPGRRPLLRDVSLLVRRGEMISIIGESGSGKSTLAQIMQRFYEPDAGVLEVNEKATLQNIDAGYWSKQIGVVPQTVPVFDGTVFYNIGFASSNAEAEMIVNNCMSLGFEGFIKSLPEGFNTLLGEDGVKLSGGQLQILGLMRALAHRPRLLILDEATSALDRSAENFVFKLLNRLKHEMCIVLITHRLHSLRNLCDRIYVLENGGIKHEGSHSDLMKTENFYSRYWREMESMHDIQNVPGIQR